MTTIPEIENADIDNSSKDLFKSLLAQITALEEAVLELQNSPGNAERAWKLTSEYPSGQIDTYVKEL